MNYDIVIVGASFAGLSLAHHLPRHLKVLILDMKSSLDQHVESTGLVTQATRDLLDEMIDTKPFIPNAITSIGVIGTDYRRHFFSHTETPWIYSTDTPALVRALSECLPPNVELRILSQFTGYSVQKDKEYPVVIHYGHKGERHTIHSRFIVGADGALSQVARQNSALSKNKRFLVGIEKVFYGRILLGPHPENSVYHFWFGAFSLGYGGWLSPTLLNGKPAFRLGLAKLKKDVKDLGLIRQFIERLTQEGIIAIEPDSKELLTFTSMIPIGGPLKHVYDSHSLLLGDAAGLCGAFAADGIKGALISGKVAAELIPRHLSGEAGALARYHSEIQKHRKLMSYYRKQVLYRFLWDRMRSDRSFDLMFQIIAGQKEQFLAQFCDSKDRNKSLIATVITLKNLPLLVRYAFSLVGDLIGV